MTKQEFFEKAIPAALASGHIFPEYAVCEAALESAWGESKLAQVASNLFGMKKGKEAFPVVSMPTREYLNGKWVTVDAFWPKFPDWKTCFEQRMELLKRKSAYAPALEAKTGEEFIEKVSKVWATDPQRGAKVLATFHFNKPLIDKIVASK